MSARRWLPYAGIAAFYVAVIVIARMGVIAVIQYSDRGARVDPALQWNVLNRRVAFENERLRAIVLRDSLEPVLPTKPGLYVNVTAEGRIQGELLHDVLVREAGAAPRSSISVVAIQPTFGTHPQVRETLVRPIHLSGAVRDVPYCVVVLPAGGQAVNVSQFRLWRRTGLLGECGFWSRYGQPGPQIQRWLQNGGHHFASSATPAVPLEILETESVLRWSMRGPRWALPLAGQACLMGDENQCAAAIAGTANPLDATPEPYHEWDIRLANGERTLFAAVEREFGAVRFQRFWTSREPFEAAFQSSFGVPVGEWVHDWLQPGGQFHRGARLGGSSILLTFLFLGLCVGAALATAHKRRV